MIQRSLSSDICKEVSYEKGLAQLRNSPRLYIFRFSNVFTSNEDTEINLTVNAFRKVWSNLDDLHNLCNFVIAPHNRYINDYR